MNTHAEKTQENKSQAVANALSEKSRSESYLKIVDNRPEAVAQRKLQETINISPRVQQLKVYQAMADNYDSQTAQRKEKLEEETLQGKFEPIQRKENNTGLPDNLKSGIENLSGYYMDDVKVHYNSDKPSQLQAHAYAQETDIHLAPGQERHLPHEAWHVVQQKQGRVKPTLQIKEGVAVNDDKGLESEADAMGREALERTTANSSGNTKVKLHETPTGYKTIQRAVNKTNEQEDNDPVVGRMNYSFKWQATDPHKNGYILQKVTRTERVNPNAENAIIVSVYWEAWKVTDGVIFNGEDDLSGIQHDSWFNRAMAPGSEGSISMDCNVYFADQIAGMAHNTIPMAGELLSSAGEPDVEKVHLFDHNYNYVWNRKLIGDNLQEVIRREMTITLEMSGEDGQTFEQMVANWDEEDWASFADAVNANDPEHAKATQDVKETTQHIQLKTNGLAIVKPAIPVIQPMKNTSVAQLYSVEAYGKLSEKKQMLLQDSYNLFASPAKFSEANGIGGDIGFRAGENSDRVEGLKEVIAFVKKGSNLERDMSEYNALQDFESVKPKALRRLPNQDSLAEKFKEIVNDHINFEEPLPEQVSSKVAGRDLHVKQNRIDLVRELVEAALKEVEGVERPLLEKKVDQYLKTQSELNAKRPLMPSDCRAMASYVAGFDAGSSGLDVTDQPVLAGDVYEYTSEHKKAEWPFHYATVIMTDGGDHVTMENAAAKASDKFSKMQYDHSWFFEMYGTKKGQTFDDKYDPLLNPE